MAQGTISQHLVDQFGAQVRVIAQQEISKTRPIVEVQTVKAENWFYDGLGKVEARRLSGRINPVVFAEIDHHRRKMTKERYEITLPIDEQDLENKLGDPRGLYARAIVAGLNRQVDRDIVAGAYASVYTGRNGTTLVTASADGVLTVDGTGGITLPDMLAINQNYVDSDVATDGPIAPHFLCTGDEETALLQIAQLTSGDYSRQFALEKGQLQMVVGQKLLKFAGAVSDPVLPVSGGVRTCLSIAPGGVCLGIGHDIEIKVAERDDYVQTSQVQGIISFGVVRTEGNHVQIVNTTD